MDMIAIFNLLIAIVVVGGVLWMAIRWLMGFLH